MLNSLVGQVLRVPHKEHEAASQLRHVLVVLAPAPMWQANEDHLLVDENLLRVDHSPKYKRKFCCSSTDLLEQGAHILTNP